MIKNETKFLKDCTLAEYTDCLIRGNYYGFKESYISNYFSNSPYKINSYEYIDLYEHNKLQYIFEKFITSKNLVIAEEYSFDNHSSKNPPHKTDLEFNKGQSMKIYRDGTIFLEDKEDKSIVIVDIYCDDNQGLLYKYTIYCSDEKHDNFYTELKEFGNKHNPYRNKKIDCSCKFLDLDNCSWDDLIIPNKVKKIIQTNTQSLFEKSDIYKKFNLPLKRGVILFGPPGTGKTSACRIVAKATSWSVLYAVPSDFNQRQGVKRVCGIAKDIAPCLLIIEDLDWIATDRNINDNPLLMELMNQLDGLENFGDIITLATTNEKDKLESAIKNRPGRFDRLINIDYPDLDSIEKILINYTKNYILDENIKLSEIAKKLDNKKLSGAHLKDICNTACMFAIAEDNYDEKICLKKDYFDKALKEISNKDYASHYENANNSSNFGFGTGLLSD